MHTPKSKKTIGIIGGMGPHATVDLFTKIVNLTPAEKDADHIHILIDNNPMIPSRVEAILRNGESPLPTIISMAQGLEKVGADFLIMPCNTASYYIEDIRKSVSVPVISIIEETSRYILSNYPHHKTIGLLGTEMSIRLGLYQKELIKEKVELLCKEHHCEIVNHIADSMNPYKRVIGLDMDKEHRIKFTTSADSATNMSVRAPYFASMKNLVMKAIFGKEGIKAGKKDYPRKLLIKAVKELENEGAKIIILGCTELPLVLSDKIIGHVKLIDPTEILARSAVECALG